MKLSENIAAVLCAGALAAVATGCDGAQNTSSAPGEDVGTVTVDLTLAPPDARCAVITVTPETGGAVVRRLVLAPEQAATFTLTGLPTGNVTVTEQVFTVACSLSSEAPPTWIADPVMVTLDPSASITFNLRRSGAAGGGQITAVSNFPTEDVPIHLLNPSVSGGVHLAVGPDDNLWFTDGDAGTVNRLTTRGGRTTFTLPAAERKQPGPITAGPDGNLWFEITLRAGGIRIGRVTTAGVITELDFPADVGSFSEIKAGADGNLWFTENVGNRIGRYSPGGTLTMFDVPTPNSFPNGLTAGPDGNVWFTETTGNKIGRITPSGVITEFAVPSANPGLTFIAAGPDGNIWFTEGFANKVGRVTPSGTIVEFAVPTQGALPNGVTGGSDGNVWITEAEGGRIARVTPAGVFSEFLVPGTGEPEQILNGPDANLWFTTQADNIGEVQVHP